MKFYSIPRVALLMLMALPPSQQRVPETNLASLRGVVINAATNDPVPAAVVELSAVQKNKVVSFVSITAADGSFYFNDVPPGKDYQLTASERDAFLPTAYGQRTLKDSWSPLELADGQRLSGIQLIMTPLSVITGKVIDGAGKPLEDAKVSILRATYSNGRRELQYVRNFKTNSKGEYFFSKLETGQYYVRVNPFNNSDYRQLFENPSSWEQAKSPRKEGEPEGYPTYYYPATTDPSEAKPINLLNGGKAEGIDIVTPKVRTRRVTGTVLVRRDKNAQPQASSGATAILIPRHAGRESAYARNQIAQNGKFDFRGVLPGAYHLVVMTNPDGKLLTGRKAIDVSAGDVANLSLTAEPGVDLEGTVRIANWENVEPPDYSQLSVVLTSDAFFPVDRTNPGTSVFPPPPVRAVPSADGKFVLKNIQPWDYRILLTLNPDIALNDITAKGLANAYMQSARLGAKDALNAGVQIETAPSEMLQIALAKNDAALSGRVLDENKKPAVAARLLLAPENALRKRPDLFHVIPVTTSGQFAVSGLAPGEYKLFAWANVEDGAWFDPEFLRLFEDRATAVHIEEAGSQSVEVSLIN